MNTDRLIERVRGPRRQYIRKDYAMIAWPTLVHAELKNGRSMEVLHAQARITSHNLSSYVWATGVSAAGQDGDRDKGADTSGRRTLNAHWHSDQHASGEGLNFSSS